MALNPTATACDLGNYPLLQFSDQSELYAYTDAVDGQVAYTVNDGAWWRYSAAAGVFVCMSVLEGGVAGDPYYVSPTGDDTYSGKTWEEAFRTIIYAVSQAVAGDIIYVAPGTYDETANGANGVVFNKDYLQIVGVGPFGITITNTDITNGGSVVQFAVGTSYCRLQNFSIHKGETASDNAIIVKVDGNVQDMLDVVIGVDKGNFTGLQFTGGGFGSMYRGTTPNLAAVFGMGLGGVGIDFDNCSGCAVVYGGTGDLTTGVHIAATGWMNSLELSSSVARCTTGILIDAGAQHNILSCQITDCGMDIEDNSGDTNYADGSITYLKSRLNELLAGYHRQKCYPWDSIGVTVAGGPNHTWGDPKVLIPVDGVTENYGFDPPMPVGDVLPYHFVGVTMISTAQPHDAIIWNIFRITKGEDELLNATSGFGEPDAKKVFVADTSGFQQYDLVWMADDVNPDGEIRLALGITANVSINCDIDFTNAYTVANNARVYMIRRGGSNEHNVVVGKYAAGGVFNMRTQLFPAARSLAAGDGLLVAARDVVGANPAGVIAVTVLYDSNVKFEGP